MTENTEITTLPPVDRAIIVLESKKTEHYLQSLVAEATDITDVIDNDGREQAHRLAMKLRNARTTIEKTGKAARDDANAFSKAVIDEQKRLIAITEGEEKRVLGLRDTFDAKIEAEKAAKAAAEAARVAGIRAKIEAIRGLPLSMVGASLEAIDQEHEALFGFKADVAVFEEFTEECQAVANAALSALTDMFNTMHAQKKANEALEIERKRMADAEREANEKLAAERAAIEEERAAIAAERAELAAYRAKIADERAKAELLERDRMAEEAIKVVAPVVEQQNEPVATVEIAPAAIETVAEPEQSTSNWKIRQYAMFTADQFTALANKSALCGATAFASQLLDAAEMVREGAFDDAFYGADAKTLVSFDTDLIDATVNCVDTLCADR